MIRTLALREKLRPVAQEVLLVLSLMLGGCDAQDMAGTTQNLAAKEFQSPTGVVSWKLPKPLREISGLASDAYGLVYAVADERANVFVLNPRSGETVAVFGLGNPVVSGDFEGVALHNNWLYLVTSGGRLLRSPLAPEATTHARGETTPDAISIKTLKEILDGAQLRFEEFSLDTGCKEIEGLAADPVAAQLWIICKEIAASALPAGADNAAVIRLEAWSVDSRTLLPEATLELPLAGVLALTQQKKFKPAGLAFVPAEGRATLDLLVISGAQRAYSRWSWPAEPDQPGRLRLVGAGLFASEHRQPEGIAASINGSLLVADEGAGKRGRLRVYPEEALQ